MARLTEINDHEITVSPLRAQSAVSVCVAHVCMQTHVHVTDQTHTDKIFSVLTVVLECLTVY